MVSGTMDSSTNDRFLLVFGSETGQAKAIAQDIADKSASYGLKADLQCADGVDKQFRLADEPLLVLVSSTTGEGEAPNNAAKMLRRLRNKALPNNHLANLRYTILGLGDTNYTDFCQCPKDFHSRLQALGAQTFYAPGFADDGTGLDVVCDPWIEGLWANLRKEVATVNQNRKKNAGVDNGVDNAADVIQDKLKLASPKKEATVSDAIAVITSSSPTVSSPTVASLTQSVLPLSGASLSVPTESPPYLSVTWRRSEDLDVASVESAAEIHNGLPFPSANSDIFKVPILGSCRLTSDDAVKKALDVSIGTSGAPLEHFRPGDAFAIVVENPKPEVDLLLSRMFPPSTTATAASTTTAAAPAESENDDSKPLPLPETEFCLSLLANTTKVKAEVPAFIPERVTPRYLFEKLLDIRSVPKKGFLRTLAQYCAEESEKRRLLELSSKQGAKDYDAFVRQPGLGFVDLLVAFPSLAPPLERIIENLPRLQARSYSVSSSPLRCPGRAHFVFNVVELNPALDLGIGLQRKGICTGMMDRVTEPFQSQDPPCFDATEPCAPVSPFQLSVFLRPNPWFLHPDDDLSRPLMMIGPGTGVAPFLGFLQHREKLMLNAGLTPSELGETWLFFGCRHQHRDFLYQDELKRLHNEKILTHLVTSFSRDSPSADDSLSTPSSSASSAKYVQHRVAENAESVKNLLTHPSAMVYICGDAKNMARNVNDSLMEILVQKGGMTKMEAMKHLADLREQKRYLQDVWA